MVIMSAYEGSLTFEERSAEEENSEVWIWCISGIKILGSESIKKCSALSNVCQETLPQAGIPSVTNCANKMLMLEYQTIQ